MEPKNENEFLSLKNYSNFLIDLGLDISFSNDNHNKIKQNKNNIFTSIKDVDDYIKHWQNEKNYNLISRNKNVSSKNLIVLSEENEFINLNKAKQNQAVLLRKMFASIEQNIDDFFIINIDIMKMNDSHIKKINEILKIYFRILKPTIIIDMCSENLKNFFEVYKSNLNIYFFKVPSISKIMKNQSLKRDAWMQLKLIKAKLNEMQL